MIETEDRAILSGVKAAGLIVAGYVAALVIGASLGLWAVDWRFDCKSWFLGVLFGTFLGLRKIWGLVSFVGIGLASIAYFKLDRMKWECLNILSFLSAIYIFVGEVAGKGDGFLFRRVPVWRLFVALACIAVVYGLGRAALTMKNKLQA
jgi:hypothetical protein